MTGPADTTLAPVHWWRVPPEPALPGVLALWGLRGAVLLAAMWWLSLATDAAMGRSPWAEAVSGLVLLLAWAWLVRRWQRALPPGVPSVLGWSEQWQHAERAPSAEMPHGAGHFWRTPEGQPVSVTVQLDLGFALLLRIERPGFARTAQRQAAYRWVSEADLEGPWRWRLSMTATSAGLPDASGRLMASSGAQATREPVLSHADSKPNRHRRRGT